MTELAIIIKEWQVLTGSMLGGIFALSVALLVAYKARRQDDLAAAMLLVGNLTTVRVGKNALIELSKK